MSGAGDLKKRQHEADEHQQADPLIAQKRTEAVFPVAQGGKAAIPGGFGTGKTVLLEALAKGLQFHFETEGSLPVVVRADEKRVRQILINLLGNAIKFTAQGHVTLRVRYAREMALIDIEDTGPGLSDDERERIFEPFTRANTPGLAAPGAGLGLTIAKMLTDLMGGELTMSSTPGVGSVFRVRLFLPEVRLAPGQTAPVPAASRPRHGYTGPRRRILVVDNEEADRELLVKLLQPLGFELRTAASGHDCLDLLAAGLQPDVILMDLQMPGVDGLEATRRLVQTRPDARDRPWIIALTANAMTTDSECANRGGSS